MHDIELLIIPFVMFMKRWFATAHSQSFFLSIRTKMSYDFQIKKLDSFILYKQQLEIFSIKKT